MNYDEFSAELEKTPELMADILEKHEGDFTKHVTEKKGMVVTSMTDYTKDREKAIGEGSRTAHEAWEGKVEALTGLKKNPGEKGLDFFNRLAPKLKFLADDTDNTAEGRAEKSALKQLQTQLDALKTELATKEGQVFSNKVSSEVGAGIRNLKFAVPGHIKDDAAKTAFQRDLIAANTAMFNSLYTPEARTDGGIQYKDSAGNVLVDQSGNPLSVDAIFAKNHAHLLAPAGKSQGGTGSVEDQGTGGGGNVDYLGKTTEEIRAKLALMSLVVGTDEWATAYKKAHAAAGLTI